MEENEQAVQLEKGLRLEKSLKDVLSKHASCPVKCAQKMKQWSTVLDAITEKLAASGTFELLFGALATSRERVLACLAHSAIQTAIDAYLETFKRKTCSCGLKDAERAASIRVKGNEYFCRGEYLASFAIYTTALMFAPEGEAPLVYSNRAAAYYHLKQYENALEDVERALKLGYEGQKPAGKLLTRKAECLLQMGRISEAKQLLANEESKIEAAERKRWDEVKRQISSGSAPMRKQPVNLAKYRDLSTVAEALGAKGVFHPHKKYPWMSSKVDLRYDENKGRNFLLATEAMDFGEVIALEKPFAALALDEGLGYLRCHHCLSGCYKSCTMLDRDNVANAVQSLQSGPARFLAPVPCTTCSSVLFCSEQCRTEAWQSYHRFECSQMTLLQHSADQQAHLALRMLYAAGDLEKVKAIVSSLEQQSSSSQNPPSIIDPNQYSSVYQVMQAPAEDCKVNLRQAITACMLVKLAHANGYLKDSAQDELFACCLLQRHISQLTANRYFLVHTRHYDFPERMPDNADSFQLASAVAPLMSASCAGNVLLRPYSRTNLMQSNVQIYAPSRYIPAGTELVIDLRSYVKDASFQQQPCPCYVCAIRDRFPIKCTACGSMMIHSGAKDGHYFCSSTACNRKMFAEAAKRRMATVEELFSRAKPLADYFDDLSARQMSRTPQHHYCPMLHNFSATLNQIEEYTGAQFLLDLYETLFMAYLKLAISDLQKDDHLIFGSHMLSFGKYQEKLVQLYEQMIGGGPGKDSLHLGRLLMKLLTAYGPLCELLDDYELDDETESVLDSIYQPVKKRTGTIFASLLYELIAAIPRFVVFQQFFL